MERQAKDGTIYQQVGKDEWTPVTRTAKDGTVYKKMGSDEWAPMDQPKAMQTPAVSDDSGFDLSSPVSSSLKLAFKKGMDNIATVGKAIEPYTSAPTRAAVNEAVVNRNPGGAVDTFKKQFGADPSQVPTGKQISQKLGVSDTALSDVLPSIYHEAGKGTKIPKSLDELKSGNYTGELGLTKGGLFDPTASGAAGAAIDIGADWTNLIPILGEAKNYLAGTEKGAQVSAKIDQLMAKAGEATSVAKNKVSDKLGTAGAKVGEMFTGVPDKEIKTYANHSDEIKAMAKASDNSTAEAADQIRSKFMDAIQSTKNEMNKKISSTLESSNKTVDTAPIIEALESSKKRINAKLYPEQIQQVDGLIGKVNELSSDGKLSLTDAHDLKGYLQDKASSAYSNPGEIHSLGTEAAKGAKSGAAVARQLVNDAAPAIAEANDVHSELHDIQGLMNKNLIAEGKPEAALMAAGSGGNQRNIKNLQRLGEITGMDMQGEAEKLAAMRTFGSPKLMAADATGKSAGRMGLAGALGLVLGGPVGGLTAAALASPAALRVAIDSGKITGKVLKALATIPEGKDLYNQAMAIEKSGVASATASASPEKFMLKAAQKDQAPPKGPDKWANDGLKKLMDHVDDAQMKQQLQDQKDNLLSDPKLKDLLIQASDLKPGTKAMEDVKNKIKNRVSKARD